MSYYKDMHQLVEALDQAGKLWRIREEINKDTELMPLVRWQFRGLPEAQRKAFLFENVVDAKGNRYSMPVLVGCLAASKEIYSIGIMSPPEEIMDRWHRAETNPIPPRVVETGPVHEEVHMGASLLEHGGTGEFPIPLSTPGLDNAPYTTASHWITKDPETGSYNIGNYRGQIKAPDRTGAFVSSSNHIGHHWKKAKAMGVPLQAALVIGAPPAVSYVSVARTPYGLDEFAVSGGLAGEPIDVVQCKSIDLLVPAWSEIVFEGEIATDYLEPEAPFGEYTGYMGERVFNPVFNITAITHRKNAVLTTILSQFPPSESSKIKQVAAEAIYLKFLKHDCNIPSVLEVAFHEMAVRQWCVIRMKKTSPAQPWQALNAAVAYHPSSCTTVIAVDEDIDPHDPDSVIWAIGFRMQPHRDILVTRGKTAGLNPSAAPADAPMEVKIQEESNCSALLIDATRKWAYPPVSLPAKEFMEDAKVLWERLGLPGLEPKKPWHGYTLGYWTEQDEEEAQLAVRGEHYVTGKKIAQQRVDTKELTGSGS